MVKTSINIPEEVYNGLKTKAKKMRISVSAYMNFCLEYGVKHPDEILKHMSEGLTKPERKTYVGSEPPENY